MATTSTEVCNLALDMLNQKKIMNIDGNDPISISCKINYDQCRREILESYYWGFAKKKASLAALSVSPAFGWNYAYEIPNDCLTTESSNISGCFNGIPIDHEIVGNEIHTNASAPLLLTYTFDLDNPARFSALCTRAIAAKIAVAIAFRLTSSNTAVQIANNAYITAINDAETHDGLQGNVETSYPNALSSIDARYI